jgi:molybdenum ABC transporter molybdate-binding protein
MMFRVTSPAAQSTRPLRLYCAAGHRVPVERIIRAYRDEFGIAVEVQYGGSNTLLNQLQVNRSEDADLYLAADDTYTQKAIDLGLAREVLPIAYSVPVIAVPKGNPKGIDSVEDLWSEGVVVSMADPDQAAIGKAVRERLSSEDAGNVWSRLEEHVRDSGVFKPTVNDVANDVALGSADAAVVWDSTVQMPAYRATLKGISVPEFSSAPDLVSLAVLKSSRQKTAALRFARYATARDRGLREFAKFGVQPVDGDVWAERPELTFYSGAVNKKVVDRIVAEFMEDEGVVVNTVYDGCGILTSRMKAINAQRTDLGFPDVYMACDRYYLEIADVRDWFQEAAYVSEADLVLVVPKGSDRVKTLMDLTKPGVRVAIGQPDQCTIGVLSWKLLEAAGLAEGLREKQGRSGEVVVEKSSSAHLVPDVATGHVDAAIAYVTDTLANRERVDVLPLHLPESVAIQPISIARSSDHKYLARRLFRRIAESREAFEQAGFRYREEQSPQPSTKATAADGVHRKHATAAAVDSTERQP